VATDILRFAVLGLGAGAVYGLTALGVVLIYRGSGVLNFAQGAVGMVGAFFFYNFREGGTATWVAGVIAVAWGAGAGLAMHVFVMRPLRHAPALSRLIATLGVLTLLLAWAEQRYGALPNVVTKLLPIEAVEVLPDIAIGEDRLYLLVVGIAVTIVLTLVYRFTKFGLATSAVAHSRRVTATQGISPDLIAACNWMLGSVLAVVAFALGIPSGSLDSDRTIRLSGSGTCSVMT
jgi:sulfate-transporting ATPase